MLQFWLLAVSLTSDTLFTWIYLAQSLFGTHKCYLTLSRDLVFFSNVQIFLLLIILVFFYKFLSMCGFLSFSYIILQNLATLYGSCTQIFPHFSLSYMSHIDFKFQYISLYLSIYFHFFFFFILFSLIFYIFLLINFINSYSKGID